MYLSGCLTNPLTGNRIEKKLWPKQYKNTNARIGKQPNISYSFKALTFTPKLQEIIHGEIDVADLAFVRIGPADALLH